MFVSLKNILNEEIILFISALNNEKEKRRHILGADGGQLRTLTEKSNMLLNQITDLEIRRAEIVSNLAEKYNFTIPVNGDLTLSDILNLVQSLEPSLHDDFQETIHQYRDTIYELKMETDENQRLLENTQRSIKKVITSMQDASNEDLNKLYRPDPGNKSNKNKPSGNSILLNTNA